LQQILIIGPSWVGDMVMAQSLFMDLRRRYPDAALDVIAPQWSLPLLARMPEIRQGFGLEATHGELKLRERYRLGRELRAKRYDQAIVLPRSFKSALVPYWARIPRRTGYRGEWRYGLLNDIRTMTPELDQTVKRFVALGLPQGEVWREQPLPQPALRVDPENQQRLLERLQLTQERPVVGMMPGAEYGPAKQWPPEYFAELLRRLSQRGIETWIFGSQKDAAVADNIVHLSGGLGRNLCGQTRLQDAVDLIAATRYAVSNDSGLMHVAAAVGCPLIAIYGSSDPAYTPPLTNKASVMYLGIECSPCFQRQCPYGHYRCLREITVDHVLTAVRYELLGG
jgi:heptosyltransferase-2